MRIRELFTADPPKDGSATTFKAEAPRTQRKKIDNLCELRGHEKKSKNHQNCYFGLNKIKYLQTADFREKGFFLTTCVSVVKIREEMS